MTHEEIKTKLPSPERLAYTQYLADIQSIRINSFQPYLRQEKIAITNETSENLDHFLKGTKNFLYIITSISAIDRTTTLTRIELSILKGGTEILLNSDVPSAAAVSVDYGSQTIAGPRDTIRAKFVGATAADVVELNIHGYTIEN